MSYFLNLKCDGLVSKLNPHSAHTWVCANFLATFVLLYFVLLPSLQYCLIRKRKIQNSTFWVDKKTPQATQFCRGSSIDFGLMFKILEFSARNFLYY